MKFYLEIKKSQKKCLMREIFEVLEHDFDFLRKTPPVQPSVKGCRFNTICKTPKTFSVLWKKKREKKIFGEKTFFEKFFFVKMK